MSIDIPQLKEELKLDEGFRECVYKCSAGKLTIGYGHNVEDNPIPEAFADQLLGYDIAGALAQCERFDWFFDLDDVRKRVIINMVFNLGYNGVSKFTAGVASPEARCLEDHLQSLPKTDALESSRAQLPRSVVMGSSTSSQAHPPSLPAIP